MDIVKSEERLRHVLVSDKECLNILNVLKSDILYTLNNYMDVTSNDIDLNIEVDEFGYYNILLTGKVKRLKNLSAILA